ncbi:Uncharacterised protein [Legionella londiniensis]|uniref:Uncharacterized protein n=2 Tax=Legionella londiniensis TaxID=45068 RepID=A0A0W0VNE0_9GAMM|nr:hypothetical protein Llon_1432 [Legionella londiniensis]STX93610.1 Uncharacterised protein [Legionella londiniensis]
MAWNMKQFILLPILIISLATPAVQAATLKSLSNYQIVQIFQDTTISSVPLAVINDELVINPFTGYFGKAGKTVGKFALPLANNQPQADSGVWTVTSEGAFCVTWQHWNNNEQVCWFVYELGNGYLFINAKRNDFASVILKDIKPGNHTNLEVP